MGSKRDWNRDLDTYHQTGVFELRVCGTVCAYFVGWRYRFQDGAKNIRAGLYFPTKEAAIAWRDEMEKARNVMPSEIIQVA